MLACFKSRFAELDTEYKNAFEKMPLAGSVAEALAIDSQMLLISARLNLYAAGGVLDGAEVPARAKAALENNRADVAARLEMLAGSSREAEIVKYYEACRDETERALKTLSDAAEG